MNFHFEMTTNLVPGMIVQITKVSPKSFWLYKSLVKKFPLITCACKWKRGILATVDSIYENGTVILIQKNEPSIIGVCYHTDVEPVYEQLC